MINCSVHCGVIFVLFCCFLYIYIDFLFIFIHLCVDVCNGLKFLIVSALGLIAVKIDRKDCSLCMLMKIH